MTTIVVAQVATGKEPPRSHDWLAEWTTGPYAQALHAKFRSTETLHGRAVAQHEGEWDFQLSPYFRQFVRYKSFVGDEFVEEVSVVWDSETGTGKVLSHPATALQGSGTIVGSPPKTLGNFFLPTNPSFFFCRGRPLQRVVSIAKPICVKLADSATRWAVFLVDHDEVSFDALLFDLGAPQPLLEQLTYMKPSVVVPEGMTIARDRLNSETRQGLPPELQGAFIFASKAVVDSVRVGDYLIPVKWRLGHCLSEKEVLIELDRSSLLVDAQPEHGFDFQFPEGATVHDALRNVGYSVGSEGPVKAETISEAILDRLLEEVGFTAGGAFSTDRDVAMATGCGANVAYMALAMLGRPRSLRGIRDELGIREGQPFTTLAEIVSVARRAGIEPLAVAGGEGILHTGLKTPVLLHSQGSRRGHRIGPRYHHHHDHFYLIDDYDQATETVRVFDPPNRSHRRTLESVKEDWSGMAILFDPEAVRRFKTRATTTRVAKLVAGFIGGGAFLLLVMRLLRRRRLS